MGNSKSHLLNFVAHLLDENNDSALRRFVVDPITTSEEAGLTKAERAVLRRAVAGLSNNSKNGYSIDRSLSSYRRSLRLVQNVFHHVGSKMAQEAIETNVAATAATATYSLILNWPHASNNPTSSDPNVSDGNTYTCKTNKAVDANGGPYTQSSAFHISLPGPVTIDSLMDALKAQGLVFTSAVVPTDGVQVINSFTIGGNTYLADLTNPCYNLQSHPDADFAFWFWSVNGKAGPNTPPMGTVSYKGYALNPNDTVYWQLLAPDSEYNFAKCEAHPQNYYAKAKA